MGHAVLFSFKNATWRKSLQKSCFHWIAFSLSRTCWCKGEKLSIFSHSPLWPVRSKQTKKIESKDRNTNVRFNEHFHMNQWSVILHSLYIPDGIRPSITVFPFDYFSVHEIKPWWYVSDGVAIGAAFAKHIYTHSTHKQYAKIYMKNIHR